MKRELKLILDSTHDAMIAVDQDGIITLFNRAAEVLTNSKSADVMGLPIQSVVKNTLLLEVMKTGVKVSIDKEKKLIVTIKKNDLAKQSADARPEVFSPGNVLDAKITELDMESRKIKLSVKAAQIDEEKSLVAKFGAGATKSGATLKGIFEKALGGKKKKKEEK